MNFFEENVVRRVAYRNHHSALKSGAKLFCGLSLLLAVIIIITFFVARSVTAFYDDEVERGEVREVCADVLVKMCFVLLGMIVYGTVMIMMDYGLYRYRYRDKSSATRADGQREIGYIAGNGPDLSKEKSSTEDTDSKADLSKEKSSTKDKSTAVEAIVAFDAVEAFDFSRAI